jgi:uncharacterized protein YacL (UPF0231 family)
MDNRFFRDAQGDLRAETGRDRRLLGRFLEADIQGSIGMCDQVLAALDDIIAGRRKRWQLTGNAHTLTVSKHRARIQAEFGSDQDLVLAPAELRQALLEWKTLLDITPASRPRRGKGNIGTGRKN